MDNRSQKTIGRLKSNKKLREPHAGAPFDGRGRATIFLVSRVPSRTQSKTCATPVNTSKKKLLFARKLRGEDMNEFLEENVA